MKKKGSYSAAERAELWGRWKAGESLSDIARALERMPGTIHTTLSERGGIAPRTRTRSVRALRLDEREEISRGLAAGCSIREVARQLGRAASTVSREVNRNGGRVKYRAGSAEKRAWKQGLRPKRCKLAQHGRLRRLVAARLSWQWSPEQVSGWLCREFPGDPSMRISTETIYRSLYVQARGVLKKELLSHLRRRRVMRKARTQAGRARTTAPIQGETSIRERPKEVDSRTVPGHWEGDLLSGGNNSHVATLVERVSRLTLVVRLKGKDAESVRTAIVRHLKRLPDELTQSLTWDRGSELAQHQQLALDANLDVFFCDPRSPWQRGSNENTNGLLRQYLPKKADLSKVTQAELSQIARRLNQRPRKTLDFDTPANVFNQMLR